ncbi:P63C domain-containing protein [Stenotrophomonas lacuserhaii]|uniref:P63C domain-containing protein n=1 Tax=Stenotrophomonas lacuserhaii TaxID=2760084 RepID=UPI0015FA433A|nr:P63C domain-containing protein [Stenotrophomonas lacuserhaii]
MDTEDQGSKQSRGGKARKTALTAERRKEIAKDAAEVRWAPKATHQGELTVGDASIRCFVLEDGRRVISGRGLTEAIGMLGRGQGAGRLVSHPLLKSPKNKDLIVAIQSPIKFLGLTPKLHDGYEATVLQDLCEAVLDARAEGLAKTVQEQRYAQQAEMLVRAFAKVGIVALVDEATGFQDVRPQNALHAYLEMVIRKDLAAWVKRFPDEFYENIYKLKGWKWPGMQKNRFSVVGRYTRDLVYERLAPGVLEELEKKSPKNESGNRRSKLHQWLTDDIGHPMLSQHMHALIMFQRLAIANGDSWEQFVKSVDQVIQKRETTIEMRLPQPSPPEPEKPLPID